MASVDALAALKKSPEAWNEYRAMFEGRIDLTLADLRTLDLRHRSFHACDLSGSELDHANLDYSTFDDVLMHETSLHNASLISCTARRLEARTLRLDSVVIRDSAFSDSHFSNVQLAGARVSRSTFDNCVIDKAEMDDSVVMNSSFGGCQLLSLTGSDLQWNVCKLERARIQEVRWVRAEVSDCDFSQANVIDVQLSDGILDSAKFVGANITRLKLSGTTVHGLDLTAAMLREVSLAELDICNSTMLDAVIANCRWPRQRPTIQWSGRYIKSSNLLGQPVQDLRGLSPKLRREIADAQYLDELHQESNGILGKTALWIWGVSSAYGQSIVRLSAVSLLLIVALTAALMISEGTTVSVQGLHSIRDSIADVGASFLGVAHAEPAGTKVSASKRAVILSARITGFFVLGLWIGIAAQRLARLSAE